LSIYKCRITVLTKQIWRQRVVTVLDRHTLEFPAV
jgi:hypothetical protein